jgi:SAM-dependent methyltransferase
MSNETIKSTVREHYGKAASALAEGRSASCCGGDQAAGSCCGGEPSEKAVQSGLYSPDQLMALPHGVGDASWGSGNPVAFADLQPGEVVLDLGSGGGLDCLLAAQKVGPAGRAIGVDMTPQMLSLAWKNAAAAGVDNVDFRRGELEALPVADASVDVIISNCVINLSPDKDKVFAEAYRVLRSGGRFVVSDIVLLQNLPDAMLRSSRVWCECVAGALAQETFLEKAEQAGFVDVHIVTEGSKEYAPGVARSVLVKARKP